MDRTGYAKTSVGKFRIRIKEMSTLDLYTREKVISGYSIHIGGKDIECVYITIPKGGTTGTLVRLDSKTGCSIDPPYTVGGKKTIEMVHLGFSLIFDLFPHIKTLELDDSASFMCELPDNKKYATNMTEYELFFNQSAYYESRFGAKLSNPDMQRLYESIKPSFTDPSKKPQTFDFRIPELEKAFAPLYAESETWKEFAEKIETAYKSKEGGKKCAAVYIWLKSALSHICNNISFSGQKWSIELRKDMHKIPYKATSTGGGKSLTRRRSRRQRTLLDDNDINGIVGPTPQEYLSMNWSTVLP